MTRWIGKISRLIGKEAYGYRVLVKNKQEIRKVFSDLEIEAATIEDVMLYCVKGEKVA